MRSNASRSSSSSGAAQHDLGDARVVVGDRHDGLRLGVGAAGRAVDHAAVLDEADAAERLEPLRDGGDRLAQDLVRLGLAVDDALDGLDGAAAPAGGARPPAPAPWNALRAGRPRCGTSRAPPRGAGARRRSARPPARRCTAPRRGRRRPRTGRRRSTCRCARRARTPRAGRRTAPAPCTRRGSRASRTRGRRAPCAAGSGAAGTRPARGRSTACSGRSRRRPARRSRRTRPARCARSGTAASGRSRSRRALLGASHGDRHRTQGLPLRSSRCVLTPCTPSELRTAIATVRKGFRFAPAVAYSR